MMKSVKKMWGRSYVKLFVAVVCLVCLAEGCKKPDYGAEKENGEPAQSVIDILISYYEHLQERLPATYNAKLDKLLDGDWFIYDAENKTWSCFATLTFSAENHRYCLYDGCNNMSADYYYNGDKLVFKYGPSTLIGCGCECFVGVPGAPCNVRKEVNDGTLAVTLDDNGIPLYLRKQGRWMLAGDWMVAELNGKPLEGAEVLLSFADKSDEARLIMNGKTTDLKYKVKSQTALLFEAESRERHDSGPIAAITEALGNVSEYRPAHSEACKVKMRLYDKDGNVRVLLAREDPRAMHY